MLQNPIAKLVIFSVFGLILLAAIVQQVRYPHSAAWIVAALGAGYLLLALVVRRLRADE